MTHVTTVRRSGGLTRQQLIVVAAFTAILGAAGIVAAILMLSHPTVPVRPTLPPAPPTGPQIAEDDSAGWLAYATAHPKDASAWANLCIANARGQHSVPQGIQHCDTAMALAPADAGPLIERGFLNLKMGHLAPARADFDKAVVLAPADPRPLFGRAVLLAQHNQEAAAKPDWCGAVRIDPQIQQRIERTYQFLIAGELDCKARPPV